MLLMKVRLPGIEVASILGAELRQKLPGSGIEWQVCLGDTNME